MYTRTSKEGSGDGEDATKTMALVKPNKEAPTPEPVCESQDGGGYEGKKVYIVGL